jgi:hypothetical protein
MVRKSLISKEAKNCSPGEKPDDDVLVRSLSNATYDGDAQEDETGDIIMIEEEYSELVKE